MDEEQKPALWPLVTVPDYMAFSFNGRIIVLRRSEDGQWIDDGGMVWDLDDED